MKIKITLSAFLLLFPTLQFSNAAETAIVTVVKSDGKWTLKMWEEPFFIKGVGLSHPKGENDFNYFQMARDMGANSIRTWGVKPREFFDQAYEHYLMVNAGVWYNAIRGGYGESYTNPKFTNRLKQETLDFVKEFKTHPAILMWNLGNEVIAFSDNEEEKIAFSQFLEDVIQAVKLEDPNHPVIYACSGTKDVPYLAEYVPSLDIVGINTYGTFNNIDSQMQEYGYDKPVVATEFGALGAWDRPRDQNDQPYDPYDHNKAGNFANLWKQIEKAPGSLGGYAFVLGEPRNQDSLTWYNINYEDKKRQAYWTLYTLYTGQEPKNNPPKIRLMKVDNVTDVPPEGEINIELRVDDPDGDRLKFDYFFTDIAGDPLIVETANFFKTKIYKNKKGLARLQSPKHPGIYRVYAIAEDGHGNVAVANRSILVD